MCKIPETDLGIKDLDFKRCERVDSKSILDDYKDYVEYGYYDFSDAELNSIEEYAHVEVEISYVPLNGDDEVEATLDIVCIKMDGNWYFLDED